MRRQIAEIALFEIAMAEKNFNEALEIIKKIMNHEQEYLSFRCISNRKKSTCQRSYNKTIYHFFIQRLLESNQYNFPLYMMKSGCIESWKIESKIYDILLNTNACTQEVEKIIEFFLDGEIKNEFLCANALLLIKNEQIKEAIDLILRRVKLTIPSFEVFRSTMALSDVIEKLVAKGFIDEAIQILIFMSQTKEKIYTWGFQVVFDYLVKNNKERLSKLIVGLDWKSTFKALVPMIKIQLKCVHHTHNKLIKKEAKEAAYLIKMLPHIEKREIKEAREICAKKLIKILNEKNLNVFAEKLESFIFQ